MKRIILLIVTASQFLFGALRAQEAIEAIQRELQDLRRRVAALEQTNLLLKQRIVWSRPTESIPNSSGVKTAR